MTTNSVRAVGRPPGQSAKGVSTRRHIIDSAATVFAEIGFDRARMSELIAATGMTKGAVYFHFDSKESLAIAVLDSKQNEWIADVERRLGEVPRGGARLRALLPAMLALHHEDPTTWAISKLTYNLTEIESTRSSARELTGRWIDLIASLIRDSQTLGDTPADVLPEAAALVLVGAFDGLKSLHDAVRPGDDHGFAASGDLLNRIALGYLVPGA